MEVGPPSEEIGDEFTGQSRGRTSVAASASAISTSLSSSVAVVDPIDRQSVAIVDGT